MMKKRIFFKLRIALGLLIILNIILISNIKAEIICPEDRGISSGAGHPDIDLTIRGWVPSGGVKSLIPYTRGLSGNELEAILDYRRAPQLSTLLENNKRPEIVSLYDVNNWDWNSGPIGVAADPIQHQELSDFVSMIGLKTNAGQNVLVPKSRYGIGGGYEVLVLYATNDSITIKYTGEDDMMWGYGIHLIGFDVNQEILDAYNFALIGNRAKLPILCAGSLLGKTREGEIKVAIRDTGSFMDPRWEYDWWNGGPASLNTSCPIERKEPLPTKCIETDNYSGSDRYEGPGICQLSDSAASGEYRPIPCMHCSLNELKETGEYYSCGEPFTFVKEARYNCGDIFNGLKNTNNCTTNGEVISRDWTGDILIDTSMSKVPFVGYHTTLPGKNGYSVNTNLYLNDYFAGTLGYDGMPIDMGVDGYDNMLLEAGVYRKLAPKELQDRLKEKLKNDGHDYKVTNGVDEKNLQQIIAPPKIDSYLAVIADELAAGKIRPQDVEQRQKEQTQKWQEEYNKWQESPDGQLWPYVPMFTLEDSPSNLEFQVEKLPSWITTEEERTSGYFDIINYKMGHVMFPMSVPHIARLREISQAMNDMLMPTMEQMGLVSYVEGRGSDYVVAAPSFSSIVAQSEKVVSNTSPSYSKVLGTTIHKYDDSDYKCQNEEESGAGCIDNNPITDSSKKDPICCGSTLGIDFDAYKIQVPQSEIDACNIAQIGVCKKCKPVGFDDYIDDPICDESDGTLICEDRGQTLEFSQPMERAVSVQFKIPYLGEIYELTLGKKGFYNIFKTQAFAYKGEDPSTFVWPDTDAKTDIRYKTITNQPNYGTVDDEYRELYLPYLGGIHKTKKCVSENLLAPAELAGPSDNCDFEKADRGFYPTGRSGESPFPTYMGDCFALADGSVPTIADLRMKSGCFEQFCLYIQGDRNNQGVPLGMRYVNPYGDVDNPKAGINEGMWQDDSMFDAQGNRINGQNISDDTNFEKWTESQALPNDNQSSGACDYMINMHVGGYKLYNACFAQDYQKPNGGGIGTIEICFSNKYANASTANLQYLKYDYVNGQLVVTYGASAYTEGVGQVYQQICFTDNNGRRDCNTPSQLSDDPNQPSEISYGANP